MINCIILAGTGHFINIKLRGVFSVFALNTSKQENTMISIGIHLFVFGFGLVSFLIAKSLVLNCNLKTVSAIFIIALFLIWLGLKFPGFELISQQLVSDEGLITVSTFCASWGAGFIFGFSKQSTFINKS